MHTISYMAFLSARICAGVTSCMTLAFISIALVLATNSLLLASATWGEGGRPVVRGRRNAAREAVKVVEAGAAEAREPTPRSCEGGDGGGDIDGGDGEAADLLLLRHRHLQRLVIGQQLRVIPDRDESVLWGHLRGTYILSMCGFKRTAAPGTDPASQRPPSRREPCAPGSVHRCCSTCVVPRYGAALGASALWSPQASCPAPHSYAFGAAGGWLRALYVHPVRVQPTSRLCVNTVQRSLISLSRDLTTSGCFEGLPASFEATASNPAAASRPPGDAVAPSARTVTNHIFVDDVSNSATGSFRVKEGVNAGIKSKIT